MATADFIKCPHCNSNILPNLVFCPLCGKRIHKDDSIDPHAQSPYDVLQVSIKASDEVITASYKALARKYHPDSGSGNNEKMQELNAAYEMLNNKSKRAKWDNQNTSNSSKQYASSKPNNQEAKKPPKASSPSGKHSSEQQPKGFNQIFLILSLVVGAVLFWIIFVDGRDSINSLSVATPRSTPYSTSTSIYASGLQFAATENASYISGCIPFHQVTAEHVGQYLCVYGIVFDTWSDEYFDEQSETYISTGYLVFNEEKTAGSYYFRTLVKNRYYTVPDGECVRVEGVIKKYGNANYTYIDHSLDDSFLYTLPSASCGAG